MKPELKDLLERSRTLERELHSRVNEVDDARIRRLVLEQFDPPTDQLYDEGNPGWEVIPRCIVCWQPTYCDGDDPAVEPARFDTSKLWCRDRCKKWGLALFRAGAKREVPTEQEAEADIRAGEARYARYLQSRRMTRREILAELLVYYRPSQLVGRGLEDLRDTWVEAGGWDGQLTRFQIALHQQEWVRTIGRERRARLQRNRQYRLNTLTPEGGPEDDILDEW